MHIKSHRSHSHQILSQEQQQRPVSLQIMRTPLRHANVSNPQHHHPYRHRRFRSEFLSTPVQSDDYPLHYDRQQLPHPYRHLCHSVTPPARLHHDSLHEELYDSYEHLPNDSATQRQLDLRLNRHQFDSKSDPSSSFMTDPSDDDDAYLCPDRNSMCRFDDSQCQQYAIHQEDNSDKKLRLQQQQFRIMLNSTNKNQQHQSTDSTTSARTCQTARHKFHLIETCFELHKKRQTTVCKQFFARWSDIAFKHPYKCILSTIILTIILGTGLTPGYAKWIEGADKLYTLQQSRAKEDSNLYSLLFQESRVRSNYVIVSIDPPGETLHTESKSINDDEIFNVLRGNNLKFVAELDAIVRGEILDPVQGLRVAVESPIDFHDENGSTSTLSSESNLNVTFNEEGTFRADQLTFNDLCQKTPMGDCETSRILELIKETVRQRTAASSSLGLMLDSSRVHSSSSSSQLPSSLETFRSIPDHFKAELWMADQFLIDLVKLIFIPAHAYLGGLTFHSCIRPVPESLLLKGRQIPKTMLDTSKLHIDVERSQVGVECITGARALLLSYGLKDGPEFLALNEKWESAFLTVMKPLRDHWPNIHIDVNVYRSRDDELKSSTSQSSDAMFVGLTFFSLLLYTALVNFSCDLYQSKSFSGIAGTFTAVFGLISGMGLCCHLRLSLVPTALVCPFLILGIGVDDMFVILNSYSLTFNLALAPQLRCRSSLRDSGISITLTTVTSLLSLFIGASSPYLAVRNFCIFCGTGLLFGYLYVFTFFFPCMCLDAQRESDQKLICCFQATTATEQQQQQQQQQQYSHNDSHTMPDSSSSASPTTVSTTEATTTAAATVANINKSSINNHVTAASLEKNHISDSNFIFMTISQMVQHHLPSQTCSTAAAEIMRLSSSPTQGSQGIRSTNVTSQPRHDDASVQQRSRTTKLPHHPKSVLQHSVSQTKRSPSTHHTMHRDSARLKEPSAEQHHTINISPSSCWCCCIQSSTSKDQKIDLAVEPYGNVGRRSRLFLLRYYGPFIINPWAKFFIITLFMVLLGLSLYGLIHIKFGLDLQDLAPHNSYLRAFDNQLRRHFNTYDSPVEIFFPSPQTPWWSKGFLDMVDTLQKDLIDTEVAARVISPLSLILGDVRYRGWMLTGDKATFEAALYSSVTDPNSPYFGLQHSFLWQGRELRAWKMVVIPHFMTSSQQKATFMVKIRNVCGRHETFYFQNGTDLATDSAFQTAIVPWNYMMLFFESDLKLLYFVITEMGTAGATLALVAILCLPDWRSGLIVTGVMAMIDVSILGFMHWWSVKLNMISMVNLLLSIGFAVDYSTHLAHTFLECMGPSRNDRTVEALAISFFPIFHGAAASFLGVLMLGFSQSHIFETFFKMMTLIIVFGLSYGAIFLPVVLSLIGTFVDHAPPVPKSNTLSLPVSFPASQHHDLTPRIKLLSKNHCPHSPTLSAKVLLSSHRPRFYSSPKTSDEMRPNAVPPDASEKMTATPQRQRQLLSSVARRMEDKGSVSCPSRRKDSVLPTERKCCFSTRPNYSPVFSPSIKDAATHSVRSLPIFASPAISPLHALTPSPSAWRDKASASNDDEDPSYGSSTPIRRSYNTQSVTPIIESSQQKKLILPGIRSVSSQSRRPLRRDSPITAPVTTPLVLMHGGTEGDGQAMGMRRIPHPYHQSYSLDSRHIRRIPSSTSPHPFSERKNGMTSDGAPYHPHFRPQLKRDGGILSITTTRPPTMLHRHPMLLYSRSFSSSQSDDDGDLDSPIPRSTDRRQHEGQGTASLTETSFKASADSKTNIQHVDRVVTTSSETLNAMTDIRQEEANRQTMRTREHPFASLSTQVLISQHLSSSSSCRTDDAPNGESVERVSGRSATTEQEKVKKVDSGSMDFVAPVFLTRRVRGGRRHSIYARTTDNKSETHHQHPLRTSLSMGSCSSFQMRRTATTTSPSVISHSSLTPTPHSQTNKQETEEARVDDHVVSAPHHLTLSVPRHDSSSFTRQLPSDATPSRDPIITESLSSLSSSSILLSIQPDDGRNGSDRDENPHLHETSAEQQFWIYAAPSLLRGEPIRSFPLPRKFPTTVQSEFGVPITRPSPLLPPRTPSSTLSPSSPSPSPAAWLHHLSGRPQTSVRGRPATVKRI